MENGSIDMIKEQILEKSAKDVSHWRTLRKNINIENSDIPSNQDIITRIPFFEKYKGGIQSTDGKRAYFFGIIDLFTHYG